MDEGVLVGPLIVSAERRSVSVAFKVYRQSGGVGLFFSCFHIGGGLDVVVLDGFVDI